MMKHDTVITQEEAASSVAEEGRRGLRELGKSFNPEIGSLRGLARICQLDEGVAMGIFLIP
jgi:hypothetical protein